MSFQLIYARYLDMSKYLDPFQSFEWLLHSIIWYIDVEKFFNQCFVDGYLRYQFFSIINNTEINVLILAFLDTCSSISKDYLEEELLDQRLYILFTLRLNCP